MFQTRTTHELKIKFPFNYFVTCIFILFNNAYNFPIFIFPHHIFKMAQPSEAHKKTFEQSLSMLAGSFNMGKYLRNKTQALATNHHASEEQSAALNYR